MSLKNVALMLTDFHVIDACLPATAQPSIKDSKKGWAARSRAITFSDASDARLPIRAAYT